MIDHRSTVRLRPLPAALLIALYHAAAPADVVNWVGSLSGGFWGTAGNWSSAPNLPGPGDTVSINTTSGEVIILASTSPSITSVVSTGKVTNLGATFTLGSGLSEFKGGLEMSAGFLSIASTARLSATSSIVGGFIKGGGTLENLGTLGFETDGTVSIILDGTTISNSGTVNWYNGAQHLNIATRNAATIRNQGTWLAGGSATNGISRDAAGAMSTFENSGTYRKTGSADNNMGIDFSNTGTVDVQAGALYLKAGVTQHVGDTLTGGVWKVSGTGALHLDSTSGVDIAVNQADVTLDGNGASFARIATLTNNQGAFRLLGARNFSAVGAFTNSGVLQLGGGTFDAPSLANATGGAIEGYGTITPTVANTGVVRASGGTLTLAGGATSVAIGGTLQSLAGSTLALGAASAARFLVNEGTLDLSAAGVTVTLDYSNPNFGIGNDFDPRANVLGTRQIRASGNVTQQLTGPAVVNGTSTTPTLILGNIHAGTSVTKPFIITNGGTSGPVLRGALQTAAGNGNITDKRITGSGVEPGNFGTLLPGNGTGRFVTFTGSAPGALANQRVGIVNNFDNVVDQVLTIAGAVYRYAAPTVQPSVLAFGNFHVGATSPTSVITVLNDVPADGYSESLNATLGFAGTGITLDTSTIPLLAPGASTTRTMSLDTSTAGSFGGKLSATLKSNGSGSSGLGISDLPTQTFDVTGGVYRLAVGQVGSTNINFGVHRTGELVRFSPTITNAAVADPYSEALDTTYVSGGGSGFQGGGTQSLVAAGKSATGNITIRLDTASAGMKSGTASLFFRSNGLGTSGLGLTTLGVQSLTMSGKVFARAAPVIDTPSLDFGIVHVGDVIAPQAVTIRNTATGSLFDNLLGTVSGTPAGFTASGSLGATGLGAGASSQAISFGLDTSSAGVLGGQATLAFASHDTELADLALPDGHVALSAQVNAYAHPVLGRTGGDGGLNALGATQFVYDFGTLSGSADVSALLDLTNLVAGPADTLGATFSVGTGPFSLGGFSDFAGLAAGGAHDLTVDLHTLTSGLYEQAITIALFGENASGYHGSLGSFELTLRANVLEAAPVPLPGGLWLMTGVVPLLLRRRRV